MIRSSRIPTLFFLVLLCGSAANAGKVTEDLWFGGGLSLDFGTVDYVAIEPVVGYDATDRISFGLGLVYRYSDDSRFNPDLTTSDYGASLFGRYGFAQRFFAQAEYEYLNYEYRTLGGSEDRDKYYSLRAGPGFWQPIGDRASFYAVALYNFDYDDAGSPYSEPWIYRVGVGVGF